MPLFERHQFGMQPTAMGQVMLKRARAIQEELRRAREEIEQLRGEMVGDVRVALPAIATFALMPQTVRAFRNAHPRAVLKFVESFYQPVEARLLNGEIDFFVGPFTDPGRGSRVTSETLFQNRRVVIARKGHPLADATSIRQLTDAEWVKQALHDRASEGDFDRPFIQHGLPRPNVVMHTTSATATLLAVANSNLLTSVLASRRRSAGCALRSRASRASSVKLVALKMSLAIPRRSASRSAAAITCCRIVPDPSSRTRTDAPGSPRLSSR